MTNINHTFPEFPPDPPEVDDTVPAPVVDPDAVYEAWRNGLTDAEYEAYSKGEVV